MISEHLIEELRLLNRVEKLRVIQMLATQIAEEETILANTAYDMKGRGAPVDSLMLKNVESCWQEIQ